MTPRAFFVAICFALVSLASPAASPASQGPADDAARDVRVKVVADEEWRRDPGWAAKAETVLRSVSAEFERTFGIRLVPAIFTGFESDGAILTMEALAERLESRSAQEACDLLVALTAQENLARGL